MVFGKYYVVDSPWSDKNPVNSSIKTRLSRKLLDLSLLLRHTCLTAIKILEPTTRKESNLDLFSFYAKHWFISHSHFGTWLPFISHSLNYKYEKKKLFCSYEPQENSCVRSLLSIDLLSCYSNPTKKMKKKNLSLTSILNILQTENNNEKHTYI